MSKPALKKGERLTRVHLPPRKVGSKPKAPRSEPDEHPPEPPGGWSALTLPLIRIED